MKSAGSRLTVMIQYNCIPHYRARIFELLSMCDEAQFVIVADSDSDTPFLKTLSGDDGRTIRHMQARNYIIRVPGLPELYWQPHAISQFLRNTPDALIALGSPYSFTAWFLVVLGRVLRIPVLLWGHGLLGEETGPKWWLRKLLYKLASGQLLYGDYAKKLLVSKGFEAGTLHVVYNSLDFDVQRDVMGSITREDKESTRSQLGVGDGERLVVFTGRLQPIKRLDMLVEATGQLFGQGRVVHVAFIGGGKEEKALRAIAERWGIERNVHFLGVIYDESYIGKVLASADLSVIPSGAGLSIMHSMVFGTPVLIHDRVECHFPEWEAVEEGVTGFYYKYGDINDLAAKMEYALFPVSKKKEMEQACRHVIERKYNPHCQVRIFLQAVRDSISSGA